MADVGGPVRESARERSGRVGPVISVGSAGLVNGLIAVVVSVSFGVLIFGGQLAVDVGKGISLVLASSAVAAVVFALRTSAPGIIAGAQDHPSIVLALIAASIVAAAPATMSAGGLFATVVATLGLATVVTGSSFLLLGRLRLGETIRYVPYPVIGGFLAGTGWLLLVGGLEVLLDTGVGEGMLAAMVAPDLLLRWVPPVAAAAALMWWLRRTGQATALPAGLALMAVAFYVVLFATGTSPAEARADGWLLGPFPEAAWPPMTIGDLAEVDWGLVHSQGGTIASLVVIAVLSLILSCGGIEVAVHRDVDLNRELETAGLANIVGGLGGGVIAYPYTALSVLSDRMGAAHRATGLVAGGVSLLVLVVGLGAVAFVPLPVIGMILALLGFSFLSDWLLDGWRSLPRWDYLVVITILAVIATVGLLPGIAAGLVLAVLLFVVRSSRVAVVKHVFTAESFASNVERRHPERQALADAGDRLLVLELQGFLFFGTATRVIREVERRRSAARSSFVVIDLRRVAGIDSSAVFGFARIARSVAASNARLVLAGLEPEVHRHLEQGGLALSDGSVATFPDLDRAVEWCEEQLLAEVSPGHPAEEELHDPAELLGVDAAALAPYLERRRLARGDRLIAQGEPVLGLLFVSSGQVAAVLEHEDGTTTRLRVLRPGTIVGEIGFVLGVPATASVVADTDVVVEVLTVGMCDRMGHDDPQLSLALHRRLAQLASERLAMANRTIEAALD